MRISEAVVNTVSFPGVPADSRTFVGQWNAYLTSTASALRSVSRALPGMNPFSIPIGGGEILFGDMRDVVVTRVRYSGPPRRFRNLEERLMVRFPSLYRRLAALVVGRLGPRSRLRRALLRRALLSGWASWDRRDFEVNLMFFAPDTQFEYPAGMQTLGLDESFRGHVGRIEAMDKFAEVWGSELEPAYLLDLGDRVLNLGLMHTQARASGVPLEQEFSQLVTLRDGLVIRDQSFLSWEEGLRAAGLDPSDIALPRHGHARQAAASVE